MKKHLRDLSLIAFFPALMAVTSPLYLPLGGLPNITFQTFFVFLCGLILGAKKGFISILIYIVLGTIGIPVFSGLQGGIGILFSYSGGFLIGFLFAVVFLGIMPNKYKHRSMTLFLVLLLANMVIYLIGSIYLSYLTKSAYFPVLFSNYIYLPGDFIKILIVIVVYKRIKLYR